MKNQYTVTLKASFELDGALQDDTSAKNIILNKLDHVDGMSDAEVLTLEKIDVYAHLPLVTFTYQRNVTAATGHLCYVREIRLTKLTDKYVEGFEKDTMQFKRFLRNKIYGEIVLSEFPSAE